MTRKCLVHEHFFFNGLAGVSFQWNNGVDIFVRMCTYCQSVLTGPFSLRCHRWHSRVKGQATGKGAGMCTPALCWAWAVHPESVSSPALSSHHRPPPHRLLCPTVNQYLRDIGEYPDLQVTLANEKSWGRGRKSWIQSLLSLLAKISEEVDPEGGEAKSNANENCGK